MEFYKLFHWRKDWQELLSMERVLMSDELHAWCTGKMCKISQDMMQTLLLSKLEFSGGVGKMWTGRKYKCVYGLNCDDVIEVISEPYNIDRRGTIAVKCMSQDNGEEQIEVGELENSIYWKRLYHSRKKPDLHNEKSGGGIL